MESSLLESSRIASASPRAWPIAASATNPCSVPVVGCNTFNFSSFPVALQTAAKIWRKRMRCDSRVSYTVQPRTSVVPARWDQMTRTNGNIKLLTTFIFTIPGNYLKLLPVSMVYRGQGLRLQSDYWYRLEQKYWARHCKFCWWFCRWQVFHHGSEWMLRNFEGKHLAQHQISLHYSRHLRSFSPVPQDTKKPHGP